MVELMRQACALDESVASARKGYSNDSSANDDRESEVDERVGRRKCVQPRVSAPEVASSGSGGNAN